MEITRKKTETYLFVCVPLVPPRTELQAMGNVDPSIDAIPSSLRLVSADIGRFSPAQNLLLSGEKNRVVAGCLFVESMQPRKE